MIGFIPLLLVCSLNAGYVGDSDSGSTCVRFYDSPRVYYYTLDDCAKRIRELVEQVKLDLDGLAEKIPGPWEYHGKCYVPVVEEKELV